MKIYQAAHKAWIQTNCKKITKAIWKLAKITVISAIQT